MQDIIINQGVSSEVNNFLQSSYNYLIDCDETIINFKVLEELNVDHGSNQILKKAIASLKKNVESFAKSTSSYEGELLYLDDVSSKLLEDLSNEK